MKRESNPALWAAFPLVALRIEAAAIRLSPALVVDTMIRLAVWALLIWSLVQGEWSTVFGAGAAIVGLGLAALGFRWYANRKGWRNRWPQS